MLSNFYQAVLPAEGQFCLFLLPEARHVWASDLDALVALSEKYSDRNGVYFATAAFGTETRRTQTNVLALKSLRLDIDAGAKKHAADPENTYPSQRDALAALVEFIRASKVSPSHIVSSGEGLHVYYALEAAVSPAEWTPLAVALGQLTKAHGFRADPSVTTDTARILRPLGSLHNNGKRVTLLKGTGVTHNVAQLAQLLGALPPVKPNKYDLSINDDVTSSYEGPPSSALKVASHCAALAEVAQARGDVPEPFWRAMLGLVKHTVEEADIAHEWSRGYSGYDPAETERKLDAWATGPSTCAEFSKHTDACASCKYRGQVKSPIMLGRMTTPEIEQLPEDKKPEPIPEPRALGAAWDGHIPHGFDVIPVQGGHQLVHHATVEHESETGDMVPVKVRIPITQEIFWYAHWADAEINGDTAQITAHKWDEQRKRVKAFDIPTGALASRSDLAKKLAESGIQITTDKRAMQAMEAYNKAQFQRIKDLSRRLRVGDRFGLRILDDGELVAVHGKYILRGDGRISEAMLGPNLRQTADFYPIPVPPAFSGDWAPEVWDTHINPAAHMHAQFMRDNYTGEGMGKYQLAFMLGLASPLMAFVTGGYMTGGALPANGLSVSLYEKAGGKGKTTLMQAVMLAYGRPEELSKDQNAQGSTDLARIAKLSMWGTMPASFDEMGRTGEKSVSNLISSVANGSGRDQMTKEGGLRSTGRWALICLVSTNRSQRDMVTANEAESSAVQYRMLELDMNGMPDFDIDARNQFARQWAKVKNQCAGALGAVIQRAACQMGAEAINQLVMDCVERAAKLIESDKEDRFQYRALGAMLALHVILSRQGLTMFNVKDLVAEFRVANENAKLYVKENTLPTDGLELLERALHDMRPHTIVTESGGHAQGRPEFRKYAIHLGAQFPAKVYARYIKEDDAIYVSLDALRAWCIEHHVRENDLMLAARASKVALALNAAAAGVDEGPRFMARINLYRGMAESTGGLVRCVGFSVSKLSGRLGGSLAQTLESDNVVPLRQDGERAA